MIPRYILDSKKDPDINHKYILEYMEIMFQKRIKRVSDIFDVSLSKSSLENTKTLEMFVSKNLQIKLREIFRTSDIQKLRYRIETIGDLITILRSIARYFKLDWQSYYSPEDTIYVISEKKMKSTY